LSLTNKIGGVNIRQVDVEEELAWRRGYYVFKNARLEDVASTLQYWYNVKIIMTSNVTATTAYTGVVNKEEPIEVFMRRLEEVSNVKCSRQDNTIMIY
jgi:ferric-dicitrate binding protein FerR (iron transport regulator)